MSQAPSDWKKTAMHGNSMCKAVRRVRACPEEWNGQCDQAVGTGVRAGPVDGGGGRQAGAGPVGQARPWVLLRVQRRPPEGCRPATTRSALHFLAVPLVVRCRMVQGGKIGPGNSIRKVEGLSS